MIDLGLPNEIAENVNDMISGLISDAGLMTTKSTLMRNNGGYFHAILGINNKQNSLSTEIGKHMSFFS
jgi:hypothetical protein